MKDVAEVVELADDDNRGAGEDVESVNDAACEDEEACSKLERGSTGEETPYECHGFERG